MTGTTSRKSITHSRAMSNSATDSKSTTTASTVLSFINDRRNGKVDATPAMRMEDLACSTRPSQSRRMRAAAMIMTSSMQLAYRTFPDRDGQLNGLSAANHSGLNVLMNAKLTE